MKVSPIPCASSPEELWRLAVRAPDGCLLFTPDRWTLTYPVVKWNGERARTAHRIAYAAAYNDGVEIGASVFHHCGVKRCVEPEHLYLGARCNYGDEVAKRWQYRPDPGTLFCNRTWCREILSREWGNVYCSDRCRMDEWRWRERIGARELAGTPEGAVARRVLAARMRRDRDTIKRSLYRPNGREDWHTQLSIRKHV